jgi:arylsulfatase A-like enzyme
VPLIVRYPQRVQAGTRVKRLVQTLDIFPTILDVLGLHWPGRPALQGRSLLADPQQPGTPSAVAERAMPLDWLARMARLYPFWGRSEFKQRLKSIQAGGYKYIWGSRGQHALYDIRSDPQEQNNLYAEQPEKAQELHKMLRARLGPDVAMGPRRTARQP